MAEIIYNQEVSERLRKNIEKEFGEYCQVRDTSMIIMKSQTVPELIKFLQSAADWIDPFKIAGGYFLYQLGKTVTTINQKVTGNIIDSLWDNRKEIYDILENEEAKPIRDLTKLLLKAKKETSNNSNIIIGFPFPNKYFATNFEIKNDNELEIAYCVSKFVENCDKLELAIKAQCGENVAAGIKIKLLENGNFLISWQDKALNKHSFELEIEPAT